MAGPQHHRAPGTAGAKPLQEAAAPPCTPEQAAAVPAVPAAGPRWRSADLFGKNHEVEIEHGESVYRLRRTSLGKLILTK